jgi:hypothetical protein
MSASPVFPRSFSKVVAQPLHWLWEPYIPRGKLVLLDGDPGVGKSLLTLDVAARLSRGGILPDGTPSARPHVTLFLSAEDDVDDTMRPRAESAGANLDRLVQLNTESGDPMQFPADLPDLEGAIRDHRADLVVIDPVMAFLPSAVAVNSDQSVRTVLNKFATLAERTDCTLLLIRHLRKKESKKALYRGLGSMGIIGAVRAGLLASEHPYQADLRVLAVTKSNLAQLPPSLGYRLVSTTSGSVKIDWLGPLGVTADSLGVPPPYLRPRDRAVGWLQAELAGGPRRAAELFTAGALAGIPERTLKRAKEEIGVRSRQVVLPDDRHVWFWYDPAAAWPKDAPFERPVLAEPLGSLAETEQL